MSYPTSPGSQSRSVTVVGMVIGALVGVLALITAFVGLQTAALSNDTEKIKGNQTKIEAQVQENKNRTDDLAAKVNEVSDIEKVARFLSGTWKGTYRCSKTLRGLELIVYVADNINLQVTFKSFPVPSNPGAPSAVSVKPGTFTASSFRLNEGYWVDQPSPRSTLIGLAATFNSSGPKMIQGEVLSKAGTCHYFRATKVSSETQPPPI
jgi:ABC-type lipoprotein release transport system permease subunit